ncbi:AMP-ligase [Sulfuriferula nivalis]|uniref:AMP-ligase n=2 Tax=Sulfuriferula nivalis TaxID=2675298 RepID=A0A809SB22_9PROT|nr:AMP-ligase [Sulfuriferula nivalis]
MPSIPLFSHTQPDQIIAWQHGTAITAAQFLADVKQLAAQLPASSHILNMCADRYRFAVGLAAAVISNKISLLPPTHTAEMINQLKCYAPDAFCLTEQALPAIALPQTLYPAAPATISEQFDIPQIANTQHVAIVFTSGSTGVPQAHTKTWGQLTHSARAEAQQLGLMDGATYTLIGTVPPQHMYGLESTVIMPLQSSNALDSRQPFYPADICQAIAAAPAPAVLISSPVHLRALLDAGLQPDPIALIVSATAPLSVELAGALETRFHTHVHEVYGSTETGVIATRLPVHSAAWQLFPNIKLSINGEHASVSSVQINPAITLNDIIEPVGENTFLLHGRTADLVNIAGKRSSLSYLNHQLTSLPGVVDGAFYMPDEITPDSITRLAAFVVAPALDATQLRALLRACIDPAFLPRPLIFVDQLPRNATGKLPRTALRDLLHNHLTPPAA